MADWTDLFIVGSDLSATSIALVWNNPDGKLDCKKWKLADASGPEVLVYALRALNRWHRKYTDSEARNKWCFIEHPVVAGSRNIRATIVQSYMNGIVQASFYGEGYTTSLLSPAEWKKAIGIGGSANKEAVTAWAQDAVPEIATRNDQDLNDAAGIWTAGEITAVYNELGG